MGQKLPPDQLELYKQIDAILWRDWDPIGVAQIDSGASDEYQRYVPEVFRLALENAPVSEIASYLNEVTTKRMGLNTPMEHHLKVAESIHKLRLRP